MHENNQFLEQGKRIFQSRKAELQEAARKSVIPFSFHEDYQDCFLQASLEVAFQHAAHLALYIRTAELLFERRYSNPFEAKYAIAYYHLMGALRFHFDVYEGMKETYAFYFKKHPSHFVVQNWRELQVLVRDIKNENKEVLIWMEFVKVLLEKKPRLKPEEIWQCFLFFKNTAFSDSKTAKAIMDADTVCTKFENVLKITLVEIFTQLGQMAAIEDSHLLTGNYTEVGSIGFLKNNPEDLSMTTEKIKQDVEYAFAGKLN